MSVRQRIEKYRRSGGAADLVRVEVLVPSSARDEVLRVAERLRARHRSEKDLQEMCDNALNAYGARILDNVDLGRLDVISSQWRKAKLDETAVCNMPRPIRQTGLGCQAGTTASNVAWLQRVSLLCLTFGAFALMPSGSALGETIADAPGDAAIMEEPVAPEISRDAWRARVEEAKRRAKEIALDRHLHPEAYAPPPPEDPAKIASRRVLRDDGLQPGDIVSTDKGLFVFRGRPDQPRGADDFVALPAR